MSDAIRQAAEGTALEISGTTFSGLLRERQSKLADIIERAMRKLCVQPAPIAGEGELITLISHALAGTSVDYRQKISERLLPAFRAYVAERVKEGRIAEAKMWSHNWYGDVRELYGPDHIKGCRDCKRIAELEAER